MCDKNKVRQELMEIREYILCEETVRWEMLDFLRSKGCVTDGK